MANSTTHGAAGDKRTYGERTEDQVALLQTRVSREAPPWERLEGEPPQAFAAFEVFRAQPAHARTVTGAARELATKNVAKLYRWSTNNHWRARALAWDEHQAQVRRRAAEEAVVEMTQSHVRTASYVRAIADMHLDRVAAGLRRRMEEDAEFVPDYLSPRDLLSWTKTGQELEEVARTRALEIENGHLSGNRLGRAAGAPSSLAAWHATYVEPERTFIPHKKQRAMIHSKARFVVSVAGVQSGKTSGTAIKFWKRILDDRAVLHARGETGFYWLIAPNSIVGEVMREAFKQFAPPDEIKKYKSSVQTWELSDGARVQFRSAEKSETLVARRLHGAWLDEFTLMKPGIWLTSVRQRLVTTQGWALFSGTPRGKNWAWDEIWRRCLDGDEKHDQDYAGFTWHSEENPLIPQEEIEAAKRQLPEAYFEREYRASWASFHGQIYQHWREERHVVKGLGARVMAIGTYHVIGVDWGTAAAGCAVVVRCLPNGERHVIEEIYAADKLPEWWTARITELWERHRATAVYCDPEDKGRILSLQSLGLPATQADNRVYRGIMKIASLVKTNFLKVDHACDFVKTQLEAYHWRQDSRGVRVEQPAKGMDHACDAVRYAIFTDAREKLAEQVGGYGTNKKRN